MKQLWSVLFFPDFCSFFSLSPTHTDNSCINRTDTIVKISFFSPSHGNLYSQSVSDWPYPCGIYIYIHVIRNTHLHTGWRRKTNDIQQCIAKLMSIITHILYTLFLLIERQKIILSENKFDYLIASILVNIIEREWHLTDVYNTNMVLFDILLNVNRCRRCFHKFLSNMTLVIRFFFLSIFLYIRQIRPMN